MQYLDFSYSEPSNLMHILNKLKGFLKTGQVVAITGARRVSFLMRQLIQ